VRAAGGVVGGDPGVGEKLEEAFLQGERVGAVQWAADHEGDSAGVCCECSSQAQGEGFNAGPPWFVAMVEAVLQDLAEQPLP